MEKYKIELMNTPLETFKKEVLGCRNCRLSATRHNVIFGEGPAHAPLLLIGEAPGREEDLQGRPFVGRSGQLLDRILAACGFNRQDHVFITSVVKCRPPGNRVPAKDEIVACLPYMIRQIGLIDPVILVLLGSTALKSMAGPDKKITRLRGSWIHWNGRLAMPVYHPAALLRDPGLKKDTWEDFKKIISKYRELVDPSHRSPHF